MKYIFENLILEKNEIKEIEKINYDIKYKDYNKFKTIKTTQHYLKNLCKINNLNITGNKTILKQRLYYNFKGSFFSNKIKKIWKQYVFKKILLARGPACFKRELCINPKDFFSMDSLNDISFNQFISFKDVDNNIYGFDILSIYNLIKLEKTKALNPYNRNKLPTELKNNIDIIVKYSKFLNNNIETEINNEKPECYKTKIIELVQHINNLGNYVNYEWFLTLTKQTKITFIRELCDIWNYRAQLTHQVKCDIFPPTGNLFFDINLLDITRLNEEAIDIFIIKIIDRLIKTSNNSNNQILGANYVLCALTLVNNLAANAYPWLFHSVSHY